MLRDIKEALDKAQEELLLLEKKIEELEASNKLKEDENLKISSAIDENDKMIGEKKTKIKSIIEKFDNVLTNLDKQTNDDSKLNLLEDLIKTGNSDVLPNTFSDNMKPFKEHLTLANIYDYLSEELTNDLELLKNYKTIKVELIKNLELYQIINIEPTKKEYASQEKKMTELKQKYIIQKDKIKEELERLNNKLVVTNNTLTGIQQDQVSEEKTKYNKLRETLETLETNLNEEKIDTIEKDIVKLNADIDDVLRLIVLLGKKPQATTPTIAITPPKQTSTTSTEKQTDTTSAKEQTEKTTAPVQTGSEENVEQKDTGAVEPEPELGNKNIETIVLVKEEPIPNQKTTSEMPKNQQAIEVQKSEKEISAEVYLQQLKQTRENEVQNELQNELQKELLRNRWAKLERDPSNSHNIKMFNEVLEEAQTNDELKKFIKEEKYKLSEKAQEDKAEQDAPQPEDAGQSEFGQENGSTFNYIIEVCNNEIKRLQNDKSDSARVKEVAYYALLNYVIKNKDSDKSFSEIIQDAMNLFVYLPNKKDVTGAKLLDQFDLRNQNPKGVYTNDINTKDINTAKRATLEDILMNWSRDSILPKMFQGSFITSRNHLNKMIEQIKKDENQFDSKNIQNSYKKN